MDQVNEPIFFECEREQRIFDTLTFFFSFFFLYVSSFRAQKEKRQANISDLIINFGKKSIGKRKSKYRTDISQRSIRKTIFSFLRASFILQFFFINFNGSYSWLYLQLAQKQRKTRSRADSLEILATIAFKSHQHESF